MKLIRKILLIRTCCTIKYYCADNQIYIRLFRNTAGAVYTHILFHITLVICFSLAVSLAGTGELYCQETARQVTGTKNCPRYSIRLNEKIYLHTDRLFYMAGEDIWFRIFLLEESTLESSAFSKVAYVELLDRRNEVLSRLKIAVGDTGGCGHMEIPPALHSGYYYIRAYTYWMKNYSPSGYFLVALAVINPEIPLYEAPDTSLLTVKDNIHVGFYPEGGKLVNGVECLTALVVTGRNGEPAEVSGVVAADGDSPVAEFITRPNGLGSFRFTPEAGKKYYALIRMPEHDKNKYYLPEPVNTGMVLQAVSRDDRSLALRIAGVVREPELPASCTVMVFNRKGLTYTDNLMISTLPSLLRIPAASLAEGINNIVFCDREGIIRSERNVYVHPQRKLGIQIINNAQNYGSRKKVELEILTSENYGQPVSADLSVSVYYRGDRQFHSPGIRDYLLLFSDLCPSLAVQGLTSPAAGKDQDDLADLLMLAGVCTGPPVGDTLTVTAQNFTYFAEIEGITLSGRVISTTTQDPVSGVPVFLSVLGSNALLETCLTHDDGRFFFCLGQSAGTKNIVLGLGNPSPEVMIIVDEPWSEAFTELHGMQLKLDENWRSFIERQMINHQVSTLYQGEREQDQTDGQQDAEPFYVQPDFTISMKDFVRLPNMEEVFRELVKQVLLTREDGQLKLNVLDFNTNRIIGPNPAFIVDGVPLFDSRPILEMDPEDIAQINIVSYKYYKGILEMDGIIDIHTNDGNLPVTEMPGNYLRQVYQVYQPYREYFIPAYQDGQALNSRIPDLRNLLYWNPSVRTDHEGKAFISFYTPDNDGNYSIRIEGISGYGLLGSATDSLKVVK